MIGSFKVLLNRLNGDAEPEEAALNTDELRLASAALLIEVMLADHKVDLSEQEKVTSLIESQYQLSREDAQELIELAHQHSADAADLFRFTRAINTHCNAEQKFLLVVNLWRVAYADGELEKYEEGLIRRIADLLHLRHSEFIRAKKTAQHSI